MTLEFIQLYRLPDGRIFKPQQIGEVDDAVGAELIRRHIAKEFVVPEAEEKKDNE